MELQVFEVKKLEYQMAQEMLRHYDALNWQIGSVLIAAVLILTGFVINKEIIQLARNESIIRWTIVAGIPLLSLVVLCVWGLWFRRHRILYNFRNEVLHRLELQLGMYHHLRVVQSALGKDDETFAQVKVNAGHDSGSFKPLYPLRMKGPSGYLLAWILVWLIPLAQVILLQALCQGWPFR